MVNLFRLIFPSAADYALLACCLLTAWAIGDLIRILPETWPKVRAEFRELNAQRRHRLMMRRLKGK